MTFQRLKEKKAIRDSGGDHLHDARLVDRAADLLDSFGFLYGLRSSQVCVNIVARAELVTERGAALPTRFRNVLYLDVFGWLEAKRPDEFAAIQADIEVARP